MNIPPAPCLRMNAFRASENLDELRERISASANLIAPNCRRSPQKMPRRRVWGSRTTPKTTPDIFAGLTSYARTRRAWSIQHVKAHGQTPPANCCDPV